MSARHIPNGTEGCAYGEVPQSGATQFIVELGSMVGNLVPVAAISVLPLDLFEAFGKNAVAAGSSLTRERASTSGFGSAEQFSNCRKRVLLELQSLRSWALHFCLFC